MSFDFRCNRHATITLMEQPDLDNCPKPGGGQDDPCDSYPEFAIICSFIIQFEEDLDLKLDIQKLKESIENKTELDESLIDLHVKLLKKIRRYFVRDLWERALVKFTAEYSYEEASEIEQLGYLRTSSLIKLRLLNRLFEAQFEHDQKFKSIVNSLEATALRPLPLGRDVLSNTYWHIRDSEGNLRVYKEEPLDYESWKVVCKTSGDLHQLIEDLELIKDDKIKGEPMHEPYDPLPKIFPEYFTSKQEVRETRPEQFIVQNEVTSKGIYKVRSSRPCNLTIVKEVDEDNLDDVQNEYNRNLEKHDSIKLLNGTKNSRAPVTQASPTDSSSIESQVRYTVESLINKVVSSFDFFFRPSSKSPTQEVQPPKQSVPTPPKNSRKRPPKREKPKTEDLPRRSSSRIQQLQQKKVAEQEEQTKKLIESTSEGSKSQANSRERSNGYPPVATESSKPRKKRTSQQRWRTKKGKKKLSWDKDDSDLSTESSPEESDDDDQLDFLTNGKSSTQNDDEFAREDEDSLNEPVIIKRARTARQSLGLDETGEQNSTIIEEDKPCGRCDKSDNPEWVLLCDMCDDGYHTSCCLPPLMVVPDGDWFCPACEHKMLLSKLKEFNVFITEIIETKERELTKKQRFRQPVARQPVVPKEPEPQISEEIPPAKEKPPLDEDAPSDESFHAAMEAEEDDDDEGE